METKMKAVIVEDEPAIARSIQKLLEKLSDDYVVAGIASNGKDGLKLIEEEKPQMVFTDICMPIMSGLEMIEETRKKGIDLKFVILSGYAEFDYAKKAMNLGVQDYLLKPVNPVEMKKLLDNLVLSQKVVLKNEQKNYAIQVMTHHKDMEDNPFAAWDCYFLFLYFGAVVNNVYGELCRETGWRKDEELIKSLEEKYKVRIIAVHGWRYNEVIYIITKPANEEIEIEKIAEKIWEESRKKESYVNLIVSRKIRQGYKMAEAIRNSNLFTVHHLPFGKGKIHFCREFQIKK